MDIYAYEDYRAALGALFEARKTHDPEFSHRRFAMEAGVKNPGLLVDILKGKRKVSPKVAKALGSIFALKSNEFEYIQVLIRFGQARGAGDKEKIYRELVNRRARSSFAKLHAGQLRYYDDTGYALVLAAVEVHGCRGDWLALGESLDPPLPASKTRKYVEELVAWGLLKRRSDGSYHIVERFLEPPPGIGHAVKRLNREWIEQSREATFRWPKEERHVSTLLLAVSDEARRRIADRIEKCRRDILSIAAEDSSPRQAMQLTIAYFPRSKRRL